MINPGFAEGFQETRSAEFELEMLVGLGGHPASAFKIVGMDLQSESWRNADGTDHIDAGAVFGQGSHGAIDQRCPGIEDDAAGLQDAAANGLRRTVTIPG